MTIEQKPILHGRDHSPGGADPIPDMTGGIDFDTYPQDGGWLYVETTDETEAGGAPNGWGIELNSQDGQGIWIHSDNYNVEIDAAHWLTLAGTSLVEVNSSSRVALNAPKIRSSIDANNYLEMTAVTGAFTGFRAYSDTGHLWLDANGVRLESTTTSPAAVVSSTYLDLDAADGQVTLQSAGDGSSGGAAVLIGATDSGTFLNVNYQMIATDSYFSGISPPGHYLAIPTGTVFELWTAVGGSPILKVDNSTGTPSFHIKTGATWVADL